MQVHLSCIKDFYKGKVEKEVPQQVLNALELVIRTSPSRTFVLALHLYRHMSGGEHLSLISSIKPHI